jgi:hypothetical protein
MSLAGVASDPRGRRCRRPHQARLRSRLRQRRNRTGACRRRLRGCRRRLFAGRHRPRPASGLDLRVGSAYDDLATTFGRWPFVLCLEVVEHVYFPHRLARTLFELCEPRALAIVSTPYHGYWKNLALSLVPGAWDRHHHPLCDHGHIKFWSMGMLRALLLQAGFARSWHRSPAPRHGSRAADKSRDRLASGRSRPAHSGSDRKGPAPPPGRVDA